MMAADQQFKRSYSSACQLECGIKNPNIISGNKRKLCFNFRIPYPLRLLSLKKNQFTVIRKSACDRNF